MEHPFLKLYNAVSTYAMGFVSEYWLTAVLVVLLLGLTLVLILALAYLNIIFTLVARGTTKFVDVGDSLHAVLPNVGSYHPSLSEDLDGRRWLIHTDEKKKQREAFFKSCLFGTRWLQWVLWKKLGVRFVGFLWPHTHIHVFDIRSKIRLKEPSEVLADAPLRSRIEEAHEPKREGEAPKRKSTKVDHLRFLVPRPVHIEEVELPGDNSAINILVLPTFRQVIPVVPVYYLKGDFFSLLDGAIETTVTDFVAKHRVAVHAKDDKNGTYKKGDFAHDWYGHPPEGDPAAKKEDEDQKDYERRYAEEFDPALLTYSHWLKLRKEGEDSPFEVQFRHLNFSQAYLARLKKAADSDEGRKEMLNYAVKHLWYGDEAPDLTPELEKAIPSGIVPRFGFGLVSIRLIGFEPHKMTETLGNAIRQKQINAELAQAEREKAYGVRDAKAAVAEAEGKRFTDLVSALVRQGVHPDAAAAVVRDMIRTENIRFSTLSTYVEGGASASVLVNPAPAGATTPPPAGGATPSPGGTGGTTPPPAGPTP